MLRLIAAALVFLGCAESSQTQLPTKPRVKDKKQPAPTIWQECLAGELGSCSVIESQGESATLRSSLQQVFCHATGNPYYCSLFTETSDRIAINRQACINGIRSACDEGQATREERLCLSGKNVEFCLFWAAMDIENETLILRQLENLPNKSAAYRFGIKRLELWQEARAVDGSVQEQWQHLLARQDEVSRQFSDPIAKILLLPPAQNQSKKMTQHLTNKVKDYFRMHRLPKKATLDSECPNGCITGSLYSNLTSAPADSPKAGPAISKPPLVVGTPFVVGNLDKSIIRRYIRRKFPQLKYCYEKQLLVMPGISGMVIAEFVIGADGAVKHSNARGLTANVSSCVARIIKAIRFPRPRSGKVSVKYPLHFNPASKVPPVRIGTPSVIGNLDKSIIRRYIRRKLPRIKYCYERQLTITPGIAGTVSTEFVIAADGSVKQSAARGINKQVSSCVAGIIRLIRFPRPRSGEVKVKYPFRFNPPPKK